MLFTVSLIVTQVVSLVQKLESIRVHNVTRVKYIEFIVYDAGGHGGRVVTLSPPTSAAGDRSPSWP